MEEFDLLLFVFDWVAITVLLHGSGIVGHSSLCPTRRGGLHNSNNMPTVDLDVALPRHPCAHAVSIASSQRYVVV